MNTSLPIYAFKDEIVSAVRDNRVVIITAETGAGKSTQVPQYLLDEGYGLVVTEPRRLAARTVSARVAEEYGVELGSLIGFRTAFERRDSDETVCLFATDGLALVRELMGVGTHNVLVLDEVHEWNLNIEVLLAWAKHQLENGGDFKVVVMSATLESEKMSAYFDGAPVIEVPGRLYSVIEKVPSGNLYADVSDLLREGRNVLVFQPGKSEIAETIDRVGSLGVEAQLLPLHGELSPEEQGACFKKYVLPKCVVSTNVAQTSVTIDDIDAVVDSGLERRVELSDGIEGLYIRPISLSDREQRKGRAGRTKPGIYIDYCDSDNRLAFPVAEILRTRLDQTVLRLAVVGIDAEKLDFFHQPDRLEIRRARRALLALGLMDRNGNVSSIGRRVARLPISVKYGRMVLEAERLGVVDDVITIAAILEQGGITARRCELHQDLKFCECWKRLTDGEEESDILAQLAVYRTAESMTNDVMRVSGVFVKAFYEAKEKRRHLAESLRSWVRFESTGKREDILRSICAGMVDHLYKREWGFYKNGTDTPREIGHESIVSSYGAEWVLGEPFDLEIKSRLGATRTLHLLTMVTKVDPVMLVEVAPYLAHREDHHNPRYDPEKGIVVSTTKVFFNGHEIGGVERPDPDHPAAERVRREWEEEERLEKEREELATRSDELASKMQALKLEAAELLRENRHLLSEELVEELRGKLTPSWYWLPISPEHLAETYQDLRGLVERAREELKRSERAWTSEEDRSGAIEALRRKLKGE
jgi:HrpA-like RNA helicase